MLVLYYNSSRFNIHLIYKEHIHKEIFYLLFKLPTINTTFNLHLICIFDNLYIGSGVPNLWPAKVFYKNEVCERNVIKLKILNGILFLLQMLTTFYCIYKNYKKFKMYRKMTREKFIVPFVSKF